VGHDNLFGGDRYKWSARLTVVNLTNKEALYNFLSTFSGTHYVTPRAITATLDSTFRRGEVSWFDAMTAAYGRGSVRRFHSASKTPARSRPAIDQEAIRATSIQCRHRK